MKKTIAMLSALAISASLVMPFSAFAADAAQVTKVTPEDVANLETIEQVRDYFNLVEWSLDVEHPDMIALEDESTELVQVPFAYRYEDVAYPPYHFWAVYFDRYQKDGNTWNHSVESLNYNQIQAVAQTGALYMYAPSDTKTITQDKIPTNAATDVEYTVDPAYMVTIPANVTLKSNDVQTKTVTAEKVKLDYGKEVVVKLTEASNTNAANKEGNKFHAMTEDKTSTATYTINEGTLGLDEGSNIVAAFPTFTDATQEADKKKEIKFSAASGATFAGTHTELLTFTLSVEASEQGGSQGESASDWKTASVDGVSLYVKDGATWAVIAGYAGNSGKIAVDEYNQIWINGSGLYDEAKDKTVSATDIYSENGQYSLYSV